MTILQEQLADDIWLVTVAGRLDQSLTPALEETLEQMLENGQEQLIVDMDAVTYINSGGLRCLVAAWRRARRQEGDLYICGLTPRVNEVFAMIGFDKVFHIYPGRQEALQAWQETV